MMLLAVDMVAADDAATVFGNAPTWYDYRDQSLNIEGRGSFTNPIVINTPEQLAQLSWLCNEKGNTFEGKVIVLGSDIDLNRRSNDQRVQWVPIGLSANFKGHFLGLDVASINANGLSTAKRHKVSGMYINVNNRSANPYIGLFGHVDGYIGYFDMVDADITLDLRGFDAGIVCGVMGSRRPTLSYDGNRTLMMGCCIESVSVEGSITAKGMRLTMPDTYLGGIVGTIYSNGIFHSTANVTIRTTDVYRIGGICGEVEDSSNPAIIDCVANVDVEAAFDTLDKMDVGGIAGRMCSSATMEACVTTGTLKVKKDKMTDQVLLGGMVGQMRGGVVRSCANMAGVVGECIVGGIVGRQERESIIRPSLVDCCINSGYIDSQGYKTDMTFAGGICGEIACDDDKNEHVTRCLFVGTAMRNTDKLQGTLSAIVARGGENLKSNATYCYYDKNMFLGNAVGTESSAALKPITTAELTSGSMTAVPFLNIDENADYGFRLQKGRYPVIYDKNKPKSFNDIIKDNKADGLDDLARMLFTAEGRNEANTVSLPGLTLASMPITMNAGDCAYDFVSHLTAPVQSEVWTEETNQGRSVSLTASTTIPKVAYIREKDNIVYAYKSGNCILNMSGKVKTKTVVATRPGVMDCQRPIVLNVTIDNTWLGTQSATEFAGGSGTVDDPYLVKGPAQLVLALQQNKAGEYYRQVGDITFSNNLLNPTYLSYGMEPYGSGMSFHDAVWRAHYDGDGYFVRGLNMMASNDSKKATDYGLFTTIAASGVVENLGLRDAYIAVDRTSYDNLYGFLAARVEGTIRNCVVQGANASGKRCGGICGVIAKGGTVEDCVSAVFQYHHLLDKFTPFVAYDKTANMGTISNCLYVTPVPYSSNKVTTTDIGIVKDCYWLKGYEIADNGQTLDEIGTALSQRSAWTWTQGYFPMLKTFAETEAGKLIATPLRSDEDYVYDESLGQANNYILGMTTQLQFEPGSAQWNTVNSFDGSKYLEADGDMGIIAPITAMQPLGRDKSYSDMIGPIEYLYSRIGNVFNFIPVHTAKANVKPGVTIADVNARKACLDAFDSNHDGNLSLGELRAVTAEQTQETFQTPTARQMVSFPEFRYFKGVKQLTTQLNNLSLLKDVRLPYSLETMGAEAFKGCTSLKSVTIPAKMKTIEPGAFYLSQVENIDVDPFNDNFTSRNGILFTNDDGLVAWPNGRQGEELTVTGDLKSIAKGAVYKVPGMKRLYIESSDYSTVPQLAEGGIVGDDGMPDVYVNDATYDQTLFEEYLYDDSWRNFVSADKLHRYFPLTVRPDLVVEVEGQKRYLSSMFIGFDTELPAGMTACIVTEADMPTHKAYLQGKGNLVPARSPVFITAMEPGLYHLMPYDEELEMWPLYENRLQGTGRDGMRIGQKGSAQGFILTLQKVSGKSQPLFYYDQNAMLPPYSTYLTYNTTGMTPEQARDTHYDIVYDATDTKDITDGDFTYDVHSVSAINLYAAKLKAYHGEGGVVTIPGTITFTTSDERQLTLPVETMAPAAFADSRGDIRSLNFLESGLKNLSVNRSRQDNPFFGLDRRTIIYMPDGQGHTTAKDEVNVVIGHGCNELLITEGWDFEPPCGDFTAIKATYDRTFQAKQNTDGSWSSVAYPICLPFFAELASSSEDARFNKYKLYRLSHVDKDKREVVFCNEFPIVSAGEPFVLVVNEGQLTFQSDMYQLVNHYEGPVEVKAEPKSFDISVRDANGDVVDKVKWCGTYQELSNDESANRGIYLMQSDGTFRRVSNRSAQYQSVTTKPFRSFIETLGILPRNAYTIMYQYQMQGDEEFPVTNFPAVDYNGESDMPPYDDETGVEPVLRLVDADGTSHYYDLQGRRIANRQQPSAKGIYITNGKKVIKK